jgi:SAM-dependent methyltransferase
MMRRDRVMDPWDLETLAEATRLSDWMFDQFADLIEGDVVEIGAGIGTFSERILQRPVRKLVLVERDPTCLDALERRFGAEPRFAIARESVPDAPSVATASFDFALCQNVLEHIHDDAAALRLIRAALRPGGRAGLLVPANPRLYGPLDRAYGHERRYTRSELSSLLTDAGLVVERLADFNFLGIAGWWLKNRFGRPRIGVGTIRAYEALLPGWRAIEERRRLRFGLSLVAVARKPVD